MMADKEKIVAKLISLASKGSVCLDYEFENYGETGFDEKLDEYREQVEAWAESYIERLNELYEEYEIDPDEHVM